MEERRLRIRIGAARAALRAAYEAHHRPINFDVLIQAELHSRRMAGVSLPYTKEIDQLEALELQLEELSQTVFLPRWRARRMFMQDLIDAGAIKDEESIEKAAAFVSLIDKKLSGDHEPPPEKQPAENEFLLKLLHPVIVESSWPQYRAGHLRDAVLNAFVALGDFIRQRTKLSQDGATLVEQALSLTNPHLIFSTLESESGRNDQMGFMKIISGAFIGVRNPKAHSLTHDLDPHKTAQYLVFASLLARRIAEAVYTK